MQLLPHSEMMRQLSESTEPFSISFYTCDQQRKSGGELITLERARNPAAQVQATAPKAPTEVRQLGKWSPAHSWNATRNLVNLANGHPVKVHIYLIQKFNGQLVVLS